MKLEKRSAKPFNGPGSSIVISPDGRYLAAGSARGEISIYEVIAPGELLKSIPKNILIPSRINAIAFDPASRIVAIGGDQGLVSVRDAYTGDEISHPEPERLSSSSVVAIGFDPSGTRVAIADTAVSLKSFHIPDEEFMMRTYSWFRSGCDAGPSAISMDGRLFAYSCGGDLYMRDTDSTQKDAAPRVLAKQGPTIEAVTFSQNGRYLAWMYEPANSRITEVSEVSTEENEPSPRVFKGSCGEEAFSIALSHDGKKIACGLHGQVKVLQTDESSTKLTDLPVHRNTETPGLSLGSTIIALAYSHDGALASGSLDSEIKVYPPNMDEPRTLTPSEPDTQNWSLMAALSFSQTGKSLVASRRFLRNGFSSTLLFKDPLTTPQDSDIILIQNAPSSIVFDQNDQYLVLADSSKAQMYQIADIKAHRINSIANFDAGAAIQSVAFDNAKHSILVGVTAFSDIIGTERFKYDQAELIKILCHQLPKLQRTVSAPLWRQHGVASAEWLTLTPDTNLCP